MERQLVLIEERSTDYRLDDRTREIGRRGVAAAREALRKASPAPVRDNGRHGRKTAA
jgi:hypothetical protein